MVLVHIISCKSSLLKKFFPIFRNLCETRKNFYCCCIFQRQCFPKMTWRQVRGYLKNMKRRQYEKREFQLLSCLSEIMFPYHTQLKELSGIIGPSTIHECMGRHFGTSTVSRTSVSLWSKENPRQQTKTWILLLWLLVISNLKSNISHRPAERVYTALS